MAPCCLQDNPLVSVYLSTLIASHCLHSQSARISQSPTKAHLLISFLGPLRGTPFPILSLAALFRISHLSTLPVSSSQFSLTLQAVSVTSSGLSHPLQFLHPSLMTVWVFPIIALSTLRRHELGIQLPHWTVTSQHHSLELSTPAPQHCPARGEGGKGGTELVLLTGRVVPDSSLGPHAQFQPVASRDRIKSDELTSCQMGISQTGSSFSLLHIPATPSSFLGLPPRICPLPTHETPQSRMGSDFLCV